MRIYWRYGEEAPIKLHKISRRRLRRHFYGHSHENTKISGSFPLNICILRSIFHINTFILLNAVNRTGFDQISIHDYCPNVFKKVLNIFKATILTFLAFISLRNKFSKTWNTNLTVILPSNDGMFSA